MHVLRFFKCFVGLAGLVLGPANVWALSATEITQLLPRQGIEGESSGWSIAFDGHTAVLGAPYAVNKDKEYTGAAYVFVRREGKWVQQAKLLASDGAEGDLFGTSVAVDGDTIIIGTPNNDNKHGFDAGAAYTFTRAEGKWAQRAKLLARDEMGGGHFGESVALNGSTAVIGAPDNDNKNGIYAGAAYIFTRGEGKWVQRAKLLASDGAKFNRFGFSVAVDGATVAVGTPEASNQNGYGTGTVYMFVHRQGQWVQQAKLLPSDEAGGDHFGHSVALNGDTVLIGAPWDDKEHGKNDAGTAYVFTRSGGQWVQQAKLLPNDETEGKVFGFSVALDGNTAMIGAHGDDDKAEDAGAAYVFTRRGGTWTQQAKLLASNRAEMDIFGRSVALKGNTAIVGAPEFFYVNSPGVGYVFKLASQAGCQEFDAYIQGVNWLVKKGVLVKATGQRLIDAAEQRQVSLGC